MQLPVWCACGKIVIFAGETRCEDCWADEQRRLKLSRNGKIAPGSECSYHDLSRTRGDA